MVKPGFAYGRELAPEPAAHHVHRDAAAIDIVDRRNLLSGDGRIPRPRQESYDHLQALGRGDQGLAEGHGLVLVVGAVARREANLAERVVEAVVFGDLGKLAIVVDVPARALLDIADHESARHIGNPIGKFQWFTLAWQRVGRHWLILDLGGAERFRH